MGSKRAFLNKISLIVFMCSVLAITGLNIYSRFSGKGNAGISVYSQKIKDFTTELCADENSDYDKAVAISKYMTENFSYDFDENITTAMLNYTNLDKVFENKKGVCAELSVLYSAMCHSQGIRCYCVGGKAKDGSNAHQWNRLCIDGKWYEVDIATNTAWLQMYGDSVPITLIREINGLYAEDEIYNIDFVQ